MNIFLADTGTMIEQILSEGTEKDEFVSRQARVPVFGGGAFENSNILQSFYYCDSFTERVIIPNCKRFMLDSGAFTFFSKGKAVNWDDYINRYAQFITRNNVKLFFELDIDSLIGYERVLEYRAMLESLTGRRCIPVWHKSRGKAEFIKMCKEYDYVAIGGIVSKEFSKEEHKYFPWFIETAHKHGAKIHGLGFTDSKGLKKYHFDSVDSSTWTVGNRYGHYFIFDGTNIIQKSRAEGLKIASQKALARHNFNEWKKFSAYAEIYL